MPYRDDYSRLCGPLNYKDTEGNWSRKMAILDEEKCVMRFFNPYVFCPKSKKLWDIPDGEINIGLITKIEKKDVSNDDHNCFEIQMFDTVKHLLHTETEEDMDEWINHLHRVAVDPARRQEGKLRQSIKNSLPREVKDNDANGSADSKAEQSPEHISYETKIIGGVVVRRPVSKKVDSDTESLSLSGGSHQRSMSGGICQGLKAIKEGYLTKKGAVVRNWKRRFFKLDLTSLSYYEKDTDREPIRSISTTDVLHVRKCLSNEGNREHLFEVITATRTFLIQAENKDEMEDWIKHIQSATQSIQGRSYSGPDAFDTTARDPLQLPPRCLSINYYSTTHI